MRRERPEPGFGPCRTSGEQHRVGRGKVVVASARGHQEHQRKHVHPAEHAPPSASWPRKEKPQPGEPERNCSRVGRAPELLQEKVVCAAQANVAGVDAAHPGKADEVVLVLPPEVACDDEQRQRHAAPEPGAAKIAAVRSQEHCAEEGDSKERHRVLGHQSKADGGPDAEPPALVVALKQPRDAPGHRDPPQQIERHVGHERAGEEYGSSNARRKCRDEHGLAAAAHGACHEPGEYGHKPAGDSGEEAESDERSSEERQLNTGQESGHRWVNNISPLEITRIGVSEQLVAVESVARAGHEMHRGQCEAEKPQRGGVFGENPMRLR